MAAKRNLFLVTPYLVCSLEGVTHGLYLLWLTANKGISPVAAAAAIAAGDLALLVLDVPAGVFADRLGARRSLILGSAFQALGILLFWWAASIPVVVAAVLAIAVGDAFRHGADQALVYRSCAALGQAQAETFGRFFARAQAWALAAMVVLTALGGWIADRAGFDAAWALELALSLAGLALAWAMTDLPAVADEPVDEDEGGATLAGLGARLPWSILAPATVVGTLGAVVEMLVQTTPREGHGAGAIATVIAGALLLEAAGAALVARGVVPLHPRALDAIGLASLAGLACAALVPGAALPGLLVIFLGTGIAPAVRSALVQASARDGERATVASAAGTLDMLGKTAGLPLAAWLNGRVQTAGTAAVLGAVGVVALALAARRGVRAAQGA